MIVIVEHSDGGRDALRRIRGEGLFYPFWDEEFEYRLRRLDQKVDALLERPTPSCRIASEEDNNVLQLMTGVGAAARTEAIDYMRSGFSGAKQLVICDPYFLLSNSKTSKADYLAGVDVVIPKNVKAIELYVKPRKRDAEVATGFTKLCQDRGIKLTCRKTEELHDRVWIVDSTRAYVVGASFNGLGNKCAFILELPEEDRRNFIKEVGLLRERTTRSKSA
ncbi:hypothetical protein [Acidithiobacillus sp.]|uniref:hypothetical protein n=1 Tax=Acidithiobacillus sp. TaxID=1872118 RepID=UPI00261865BF|nr:hypothetical protein [Acidithiobacillus sp.]MDD2750511.1 hypothetical protein [Acidithiobacillus sp.]MDD5280096.1 hypothetical protein [Acidithiobacillus sp.]